MPKRNSLDYWLNQLNEDTIKLLGDKTGCEFLIKLGQPHVAITYVDIGVPVCVDIPALDDMTDKDRKEMLRDCFLKAHEAVKQFCDDQITQLRRHK
jgi:hypothetical protein